MGGPRVASRGPAPPPRICRHRPDSTREGEVVVRMNWLPHPRLLPRRPRLLVPASPEPPPSIHTCPRGSARGNLSSEPLVETQALRAGDPDLNPSNPQTFLRKTNPGPGQRQPRGPNTRGPTAQHSQPGTRRRRRPEWGARRKPLLPSLGSPGDKGQPPEPRGHPSNHIKRPWSSAGPSLITSLRPLLPSQQ